MNASETLLVDGKVTTFNPANPAADAVLLCEGRIAAVGAEREVRQHAASDAEVIAFGGRRVIPGLIDSHTPTVREGLQYALELRWDGIPTFAEAMARLREMVKRTPPGHWVRVVGGFSPAQFSDQPRMPTLDEINRVAPDTPVYILFVDTSALVNGAALRALGIDKTTPDDRWPAARIERDGAGTPTGLLIADPAPVILYATLFDAQRLSFEDAMVSTRHFMREQNRLAEEYFAVPDEDIRHLESVLTFAGGKVAWGAGEFASLMPDLPPLKPDWSPVNLYGGTYRREA